VGEVSIVYFEIYSQLEGLIGLQWRWRLKGGNHEKVAGGEGYNSEQACLHAIGLLMDCNRQTPVYKVSS
jgi:uncharacterized protein YegP (UPF0339 family)